MYRDMCYMYKQYTNVTKYSESTSIKDLKSMLTYIIITHSIQKNYLFNAINGYKYDIK